MVNNALGVASVKVASIEARAKTLESFRVKASEPSENDPNTPKYAEPLRQITDMAGIRIITFFPKDVDLVSEVLKQQFEILEESDKGESLIENERFGYQLRTVLQHAWAEIEHDIQYKSTETIPPPIRRRFMSLAGMLEIADREFKRYRMMMIRADRPHETQ